MIKIEKEKQENFKKINFEISEDNLKEFNKVKQDNRLSSKYLFNYLLKTRFKKLKE